MLSERKKYNYMVGSSMMSTRSRANSKITPTDENLQIPAPDPTVYHTKKITQLENANKKMLQETTKQFQKFEDDILKVEGILRVKEQQNERLERENKQLAQDKQALIQALQQKESIIREFHARLQELIAERQISKLVNREEQGVQAQFKPTTAQGSCQTEETGQQKVQIVQPVQPVCSNQQYLQLKDELEIHAYKCSQANKHAAELEEQVYRLKEQLYATSSQLNIVNQQFSTFKLLHEIDIAKKM